MQPQPLPPPPPQPPSTHSSQQYQHPGKVKRQQSLNPFLDDYEAPPDDVRETEVVVCTADMMC